jgi:hypothetical protein
MQFLVLRSYFLSLIRQPMDPQTLEPQRFKELGVLELL